MFHPFYPQLDDKYRSGQTSVSTRRNETKTHSYPSITFCPKFKYDKDIAMDVINQGTFDLLRTKFDLK